MVENDHISLECIPDVHFSRHIIPPLLPKLETARYNILFVECGIPPDTTTELNPETDAVAIQQRQAAARFGTLDVYERFLSAVGQEPICIDRPTDWLIATLFPSLLLRDLPKNALGQPYIPTDAWGNEGYRQAVTRYFRKSYVDREGWMVRQAKCLLQLASGSEKRRVLALLLVGVLHVAVLERALSDWCAFGYLSDFGNVRDGFAEHYTLAGAAAAQVAVIKSAQTYWDLRRTVVIDDMLRYGVPSSQREAVFAQLSPPTSDGSKTT